ncbi:3-keto-5-aminohexanoate cleavage protein [Sneathiella marina]|uniref:3-keto-5-aminohexanoate cleavage protein n=1 Tax=Sneathiella marina TaxID=2950108 RepID=A0ABY4W0H1_9PROT|nr:3-keto-5-aminohexanoate cleavage protein [Sneathiella marina]USG60630.1 3-keto-5-aminohexanoate cleavage protein [Sneathiella marina]
MKNQVSVEDSVSSPVVLTVAPNGARKTKADHPALPISPLDLAVEADLCRREGAAMIHLHVRDEQNGHTLDVGKYRDATAAIRDRVGDDIVIQATTEAVGIYSAEQQMEMVLELQPEAVSLAIKELVPPGEEEKARSFFAEMKSLNIMPQFILYSAEDLKRYQALAADGVILDKYPFLLYVLGRYTEGQKSHPMDLLPFIALTPKESAWAVCAFGSLEHTTISCALAMGGHVRVGFENNMLLKDGRQATCNADLVRQARDVAMAIGRPISTAADIRAKFCGMPEG